MYVARCQHSQGLWLEMMYDNLFRKRSRYYLVNRNQYLQATHASLREHYISSRTRLNKES